MENGDNAKTGVEGSGLNLSSLSLRFCTYDARDVIRDAALQGLSVYGQTILMAWCFNFSLKRVITNLRDMRKDNPTDSADDVIRKIKEYGLGKSLHKATFTTRAMENFYWLDRWVLVADYNVRLDELADQLDRADVDMIKHLGEDGRTNMGMALVRLQEMVARKSDARESMMKFRPYELSPVRLMPEDDRKRLESVVEEMRMVRRKEEENE